MKIFILILALSNHHGFAVTPIEFGSIDKCDQAGKAFFAQHQKEFGEGHYLCVEK